LHADPLDSYPINTSFKLAAALIGIAALVSSRADESWGPLELLGRQVAPGTSVRFPFVPDRSFDASFLNMPVFAARGASPGPTLCMTGGIHGDELNGVEIVRRAFSTVDPAELRGTLIALPAINAEGMRAGHRNMSDRRDLNRAFPGRAGGSVAALVALVALAVFNDVVMQSDALVDFHTASNKRGNLPQVRADLNDPDINELAIHFGLGIIVGGTGPAGSLRHETARAGIPAIIYEAGEPYRFQEDEIDEGVRGARNVMAHLDMTDDPDREVPDTRVYERSQWIRVPPDNGGFFFPDVTLGAKVEPGDTLGRIVDPLTDEVFTLVSSMSGEIIGMALPQPVLMGFALFHVAWHE
jgi:predicted deacylase